MTGTARPVVIVGDPVLHRPAAAVTEFGPGLRTLIEDMFATMYLAEGVGLAAPQIGVGLQVFVYDCHDDEGRYHKGHIVNPVITQTSHEDEDGDEGCLSVPGPYASLERPRTVTVTGQDQTGLSVEITGSGFLARCLIHEAQHLQGVLYIDHLNKRRRGRVLSGIEPFPWNAAVPIPAGTD
ncbi:peptide deformylase [Jatrophihabitans telluris]|uniref:Peptide deformylase n=1 Tax=Jatrophihabitans telluris TaxID=2038343 RepID=A0ABY4QX76_9ACTN|nr:peptide deformylase [Jatrophihabitans telluris]UQX88174.1 peptide deformylase [Jatrophihabitans telluris]